MDRLTHKKQLAERRSNRVRSTVIGTNERPRLSVHISHRHITAQLIDDSSGQTLSYATTVGKKTEGNMTAKAGMIGEEIATKAGVSKVVFDRGAKIYHGRVKSLAEAARSGGLEF